MIKHCKSKDTVRLTFFVNEGIINLKIRRYTKLPFEVYYPRSENYVSVSKNHITLNRNLAAKISSDHVELAYDRDTKVIRVNFSSPDSGLIMNKTRIGAKGFLQYFGIESKGKFPATYHEDEKSIYIQL